MHKAHPLWLSKILSSFTIASACILASTTTDYLIFPSLHQLQFIHLILSNIVLAAAGISAGAFYVAARARRREYSVYRIEDSLPLKFLLLKYAVLFAVVVPC